MTDSIPTRSLAALLLLGAAVFAPGAAGAQTTGDQATGQSAVEAAAAEVPDQTEAVAALGGDAEAGERVYRKCKACHVLEEDTNRVGPTLMHVIGRPAGHVEGYNYSDANKNSGIVWTVDVLKAYLADPRAYLPGTKMTFRGIEKDQDLNDLLTYMLQAGGGAYQAAQN